jgi:cytochrome c oxidase subunit 2
MRMVKHLFLTAGVGLVALIMAALTPASAQMPKPWQMNFQPPATPVMERLYAFHTLLVVIITVISVFVLGLLLFAIVRFREARNPVPSRTTHHTLVEVVWTVVPVLILVVIAIPRCAFFITRTASNPPI